jgi:hypothetical protein
MINRNGYLNVEELASFLGYANVAATRYGNNSRTPQ